MTAQEFVQYMPASALASTIKHAWDSIMPDDAALYVVGICTKQLTNLVGVNDANKMLFGDQQNEVQS